MFYDNLTTYSLGNDLKLGSWYPKLGQSSGHVCCMIVSQHTTYIVRTGVQENYSLGGVLRLGRLVPKACAIMSMYDHLVCKACAVMAMLYYVV